MESPRFFPFLLRNAKIATNALNLKILEAIHRFTSTVSTLLENSVKTAKILVAASNLCGTHSKISVETSHN